MTKSLADKDIEGLKILSKLFESKESVTEDELKKLTEFLTSCIGNTELNALLINLNEDDKKTHQFVDEAVLISISISFRTRFIKRIPDDLFDRASSIYNKLAKREKLSDSDNLSFAEYANILELRYLLKDLLIFEKHGLLKLNPELQKLHKRASDGSELETLLTKKQIKKQWRHAIRFLMLKIVSPHLDYFDDISRSKVVKFSLPDHNKHLSLKKK